jgi:hypothetical protein
MLLLLSDGPRAGEEEGRSDRKRANIVGRDPVPRRLTEYYLREMLFRSAGGREGTLESEVDGVIISCRLRREQLDLQTISNATLTNLQNKYSLKAR